MSKKQQEPASKLVKNYMYNKLLKRTHKREKPTANAYNLFIAEFVPSLVDVKGPQKMHLAAQKWKSMPELDKNV